MIMTKFTFICEDGTLGEDETGYRRTIEFDAEQLDTVVSEMDLFLRGVGFVLNNRSLQIVEEVEDVKECADAYRGYPTTGFDFFGEPEVSSDTYYHSSHFYEPNRNMPVATEDTDTEKFNAIIRDFMNFRANRNGE